MCTYVAANVVPRLIFLIAREFHFVFHGVTPDGARARLRPAGAGGGGLQPRPKAVDAAAPQGGRGGAMGRDSS